MGENGQGQSKDFFKLAKTGEETPRLKRGGYEDRWVANGNWGQERNCIPVIDDIDYTSITISLVFYQDPEVKILHESLSFPFLIK